MAAFLTGHAGLTLRSIGDNRSTIPDAQAEVSYGFTAAFLTGHAVLMLRSIIMNLLALGRFLPTTLPPTT